jgi:hypothetical protein
MHQALFEILFKENGVQILRFLIILCLINLVETVYRLEYIF